jgi:APA family basic amino acid/polyamine antiporter
LTHGLKGVIEGSVLIFFGYLGFEGITRLAEETENPRRTIPKAIILSLVITTTIYILVGIVAVSIIPWQELSQATAPLALVAERVFGEHSFFILTIIALFSTFNTALVMLLSGSRLIYGIAKQKALPCVFLSILKKNRTPWIAIIAVVLASMLFLFLNDLKTVANLTNLTIFAVFISVNASLIYLRYRNPITKGFKVPLNIGRFPVLPFLGILTSLFMIVNLSFYILLLGFILILLGIIVGFILEITNK